MSISSPKETIKTDIINEDDDKNKEIKSTKEKIRNIYPKAELSLQKNMFENAIDLPLDGNKDMYELNSDFLNAIIHPVILLDKNKLLSTMSAFIKNSKLYQKIDNDSEIKENINISSNLIIQNFIYKKIEKDNILYHTGEIDTKFYFIIKGQVSELRPSKCRRKLSFVDYISYLFELKRNKENYLLNDILANNKEIPIKSADDIEKLNTILFKRKLMEKMSLGKINNNKELEAFFKEYHQNYSSYLLSKKVLQKFEKKRNKIIMGAVNREWDDYIIEKCYPNSEELLFFEPFEVIYTAPNRSYICYNFEIINIYETKSYFGDFPLDEDKTFRNETVRADEDTIIAYITNDEYINIVSPTRKIEKQKEIMLLNNICFFKYISDRTFIKNYFEMFMKKEYSINTVLFKSGINPKKLYFLKQGKISLVLNCSIIEIYKLIQLIYIKLNKVGWPYDTFQKKILDKDKLRAIEIKYFTNSILKKMKTYNKIFKLELEKKRKFQIALFSDLEIIGLEETYLNIPFISKGIVISDKVSLYELPIDKFQIILQNEIHNITESYVESSLNRILSLMERLNNLKENYINIAKLKSGSENMENYIKGENNSFESNKDHNINKKNKDINIDLKVMSPVKRNKLNINNSKTIIPTFFAVKKKDYLTRSESNDKEKKINITSRISSNELRSNKRVTSLNKKSQITDRTHSSRKLTTLHFGNIIKSATKSRSNKLSLEKNEANIRAGSVQLSELLQRLKKEKMGKNGDKKNDYVIIGNTKINIKKLRQKIKEYKKLDELRDSLENNESKDIGSIFSSDDDYIKIEEQNKSQNSSKELYTGNNKYKNINIIKNNDTNDNNINYKSVINTNKFNTPKNKGTSLDMLSKKMNKINYSKLLINNKSPLSINTYNGRSIKSISNKKKLNIEKININKNIIASFNSRNNRSLINQTNSYLGPNNYLNNYATVLSILPNIHRKQKITEYTTTKTSMINNFNKKIKSEKIPNIVKDYYSKIKQKGYIPLITNKESNTIFLRKYNRKYKDVEEQTQNKNFSKNEGILPRIYNE